MGLPPLTTVSQKGVSLIVRLIKAEGNLPFKEPFMLNRVLNRRGARELTPDEVDQIAGGGGPIGPLHTLCGVPPHFFRDDASVRCLALERISG